MESVEGGGAPHARARLMSPRIDRLVEVLCAAFLPRLLLYATVPAHPTLGLHQQCSQPRGEQSTAKPESPPPPSLLVVVSTSQPGVFVMTAYRALIRPSGEDTIGRSCLLDSPPRQVDARGSADARSSADACLS